MDQIRRGKKHMGLLFPWVVEKTIKSKGKVRNKGDQSEGTLQGPDQGDKTRTGLMRGGNIGIKIKMHKKKRPKSHPRTMQRGRGVKRVAAIKAKREVRESKKGGERGHTPPKKVPRFQNKRKRKKIMAPRGCSGIMTRLAYGKGGKFCFKLPNPNPRKLTRKSAR